MTKEKKLTVKSISKEFPMYHVIQIKFQLRQNMGPEEVIPTVFKPMMNITLEQNDTN